MSFPYSPLGQNEIRLLKPRSVSSLSYELVHCSVQKLPRYKALSYTWGPPIESHSISVNEQRFPVRSPLHEALSQIQASKLADHYLWVDAICINQGEEKAALKERSLQIKLMTQIYQGAAGVLVWLGKPDNDANNRLACRLMQDFEKRFCKAIERDFPAWPLPHFGYHLLFGQRAPGQNDADFAQSISAADKTIFDAPGSKTHNAWLGIVSLWQSPWWTRTWVYQESTIPERYTATYNYGPVGIRPVKSKVLFMFGDQTTTWERLIPTAIIAEIISETTSDSLVGATTAFKKLLNVRRKRVKRTMSSESFLAILQSFRGSDCYDPRDKVHAPLCVAGDAVRERFHPDLEKTTLEVYLDVVRLELGRPDCCLEFLGYAGFAPDKAIVTFQQDQCAIPSWVPNWSSKVDATPIPKVLHLPTYAEDTRNPVRRFKMDVSSSRVPKRELTSTVAAYEPLAGVALKFSVHGSTISMKGIFLDVLQDFMPTMDPDAVIDSGRWATATGEKIREWKRESNGEYWTGKSFDDVLKRTCVLDLVYDDDNRPCARGGSRDDEKLRASPDELSVEQLRQQMNMKSACLNGMRSRKFGFSQKKHVAAVPATAQVGDCVWALAGGRLLYVLRPAEEGRYHFIGECYVHGLMDGWINERLLADELQLSEVLLI
ncbi:heterokaryon incompatibility protein-domain-containing protein [Phyllosticta capitalensis]